MQIYTPKSILDDSQNLPIFFLLGPNLGGDHWQLRACMYLKSNLSKERPGEDFIIVTSYEFPKSSALNSFVVQNPQASDSVLSWERRALYLAGSSARRGCAIGWIPPESREHSRSDGAPYAEGTLRHFDELRERLVIDNNVRLALGVYPTYPGFHKIKSEFDQTFGGRFPFLEKPTDVFDRAIDIALYNERSLIVPP